MCEMCCFKAGVQKHTHTHTEALKLYRDTCKVNGDGASEGRRKKKGEGRREGSKTKGRRKGNEDGERSMGKGRTADKPSSIDSTNVK